MALQLNNFKFCVTDYSFIYPKGTKEEDKSSTTPNYLKLSGFAINDQKVYTACYIMDTFKEFGLTVKELQDLLRTGCVVSGKGVISIDNSYNHKLELDSYNFNYLWDLKISNR